jgi:uracil-DNA glycosylase
MLYGLLPYPRYLQTLSKTTQPISMLRGQLYDYNGIRLLFIFHPSYLLCNPDKKPGEGLESLNCL